MKKNIKVFVVLILVVMLLLFMLTSCGVYNAATNKPSSGDKDPQGGSAPGIFKVDLVSEGKPFVPSNEIFAKWTGEDGSIYSAKIDENGHAEIADLDGDFHVTLSSVPNGYTYDPNGYMVSNNNRDVQIEMLKITRTSGRGSDLYEPITLHRLGTYRATLTSRGQIIYYMYEPMESGKYSIESWVDVSANETNPIIDVYNGSMAYKHFSHRQDDGGASGSFTKNFRMELALTTDMIGNSWTFGLYIETRNSEYPVTVDFTIKYEGEFIRDETLYDIVPANGPFWDGSTPAGSERYIYKDTNGLLDGKKVKLYKWEDKNGNGIKDEGEGDDFYHLYNAEEDEYGAILFAKINQDSEVLVAEDGSGFYWNDRHGGLISLLFDGKNYLDLIDAYAAHSNSGGAHPVTEELKEFLQAYAVYQRFFNDGNGFAEICDAELRSSEEDQWMFGCLYYAQ